MVQRTVHWMLPHDAKPFGISVGFLCFTRFAELMVHKPGEAFLTAVIATLLTPLVSFLANYLLSRLITYSFYFMNKFIK